MENLKLKEKKIIFLRKKKDLLRTVSKTAKECLNLRNIKSFPATLATFPFPCTLLY